MPKTFQNKARFTLIELLVVIAIIAILASLLLPTLARARYQARNVVCANNLKQNALGVVSYTDDNDENYPTHRLAKGEPEYRFWNDSPNWVIRKSNYTNKVFKDYRADLIDYWGGDLKGTWTCPLATMDWQANASNAAQRGGWREGGHTGWGPVDLNDLSNTRGTEISYSFFFGIPRSTTSPGGAYKSPGGWFTFGGNDPDYHGMLKVGRPFIAPEWRTATEQEYRVIAMDTACMDNPNTGWLHEHQPYEKVTPPYRGRNFGNSSWVPFAGSPGVMVTDVNYAMDDGSVHMLKNVTSGHSQLTAMRNGGGWGWTWILPNDAWGN